jgi:hypothetical protein
MECTNPDHDSEIADFGCCDACGTDMSVEYGWCKAHGDVHYHQDSCLEFESDAAFSARMIRESREHDRANAGRQEAAYVAEYRPY